ncbi:MAG: DNA repair protein RadC [Hydrogenophilus sp.]|nr:DNA repair protein RadC [Hydrogenophilus sp.]
MAIRDWPIEDRPREKLWQRGAAALTNAELLAIFLRVGTPGKSALALAHELLSRFESIGALAHASPAELAAVPGIGPAKAAQLAAAVELARRALVEELKQMPAFEHPQAVRDWLRLTLGGERVETFVALLLDQRHRLIRWEPIARGTVTEAVVYPREVVRAALFANAAAVIVAHNHPAGSREPSAADLSLTADLKQALSLMDIRLLDHFIVTADAITSLAECGLL